MLKKKIYIPFDKSKKSIGGPSTFMQNLKFGLDKANFKYTNKISSFNYPDAIFFPIKINAKVLDLFKKRNKPIIQRLDGIYYPSKHGEEYKELNRQLENIYKNYADIIIFQSDYCKRQCYKILGKPGAKKEYIVLNGANTEIFYPDKDKNFNKYNPILTLTGNFQHRDKIEPIINACDLLKINFKLIIAGPVGNGLKHLLNRPYIKYIEKFHLKGIAKLLRKSDIFLYSHLNSPCSNSIIEAISCGLPVVSFNSGSIGELCSFNYDLLADVSDDLLQKYEDFKPKLLKNKILQCVDNYNHYRKRALINSKNYTVEKMVDNYIKVFKSAM